MHKWGFKQKVPRKVHVNTASKEEKERFKKEQDTGQSKRWIHDSIT
jgi:putative transposase